MTSPAFWQAAEAIHNPIYFSPVAHATYKEIGLKGFWMGYVASRSAALGTPGPEIVTATFHGFAPSMVARAVPDAWGFADRDAVLSARTDAARDTLTPIFEGEELAPVVAHLDGVLERTDFAGKPLAAAHAALPQPDDALARLWHHATWLREYHGDAHVAVLTAAGINGASANAWASALAMVPPGQQELRGWTDDEWSDGFEQLHMRGWVDEWRAPTEAGRAARARIEETTHRVAAAGIGDREATARTIAATETLVRLARLVGQSDLAAYPNPTGVPLP